MSRTLAENPESQQLTGPSGRENGEKLGGQA